MKTFTVVALVIGAGITTSLANQEHPRELVAAIVSAVEPDIQLHRSHPNARILGPRFVDVGSFQSHISASLGAEVSRDDVLLAAGPGAVPAVLDEVIEGSRIRDYGVFIRLDSLRAVPDRQDRMLALATWMFTAVRNPDAEDERTSHYRRHFRMCLDPIPGGWTVVEAKQGVIAVGRHSPEPKLDCES